MLAPLEVPPMQHIVEMRTPAPEAVLAEFRAQKGIAEPLAEAAAAPETIAEEPDAEAEEGAITPRSGRILYSHTTPTDTTAPLSDRQGWRTPNTAALVCIVCTAGNHPRCGLYATEDSQPMLYR